MSKPRTPRTSGPSNVTRIHVPADVIAAGDQALDDLDALLGPSKPLPEDELSPPLSALAVQLDTGDLYVSLHDAEGADLTGRTIVSFLLLTDAEILKVRGSMDHALSDAAACVIGALPKKRAS